MAHAIRDGEIAQGLVPRPLGDAPPGGRVELRCVLGKARGLGAFRRAQRQRQRRRARGRSANQQGEVLGENDNTRRRTVNRAYRTSGSDGGRIRACDTSSPDVFPAYFSLPAQVVERTPLPVPRRRHQRVAPSTQLEIAARAQRKLARPCRLLRRQPRDDSQHRKSHNTALGNAERGTGLRRSTPDEKPVGAPHYVTAASPPTSPSHQPSSAASAPTRAQQSNTDQQMAFRNRWSSRTSAQIVAGSWSRCHRHSRRHARP